MPNINYIRRLLTSNTLGNPNGGFIQATGGTITYDGLYKVHTFYDNDTFVISQVPAGKTIDFLLIGGGGGGGGFAGGGAGQHLYQTSYSINNGSYLIVIGTGGTAAASSTAQGGDGNSSTFNGNTSIGGGGGGAFNSNTLMDGRTGASGGGGGCKGAPFAKGLGGVGTAGYNGGDGDPTGSAACGGGGGGSGQLGANASAGFVGGKGGDGTSCNITGVPVYRAAGGGGSGGTTRGLGGNGGGGNGGEFVTLVPTSGTNGTGSGGGGSYASTNAGTGGKGILIIRYQYTSSLLSTIGKMIENAFTTSNYTNTGSVSATHSSSNIILTGGANDYAKYITCDSYVSASNNFTITSYHTLGTVDATSYGMWTGFRTIGPAAGVNNLEMFCDTTSGVDQGKTTLRPYTGGAASTPIQSATGFTINTGDTIKQTVTLDVNPSTNFHRVTVTSSNYSTGIGSSSVTLDVDYAYPTTIELNNTFKVAFGQKGGTNTLIGWNLTLNDTRGVRDLYIVDSKGDGFSTTNLANSFPYLIGTINSTTFNVSGGPSNRASMAVYTLLELKQHGAAKAFIFVGCNDVRGNNALNAQCVTDTQTIKTSLELFSTTVYVLSSAPENSYNFTTFNTALSTQFGAAYINIFTALATGTALNATYDCGDGIHENNAGNVVIKTGIISNA